jgi:HK97 family phage major capsid protein
MSVLAEVKQAVDEMNEGIETWKKIQDGKLADMKKQLDELKNGGAPAGEVAALRDRIEELETRASSPGRTAPGALAPARRWKTYHSGDGLVYELPHDVKLADVIRPKAQPEISFERWLAAAMAGEACRDKAALEFAREFKQITTATTGVPIPESYQSQWIDRIREQMVLSAAGMTLLTMDNKVLNASRLVTDPTATWHTEAASISAANPTFAGVALTAKTLVTRCTGSVEVSQDSPDFGAQLARAMAASMATELDRVGLVGSGTPPEPQGILGTSGVGQVTGVGAIADYAEMLQGIRILLDVGNLPLDVATRVAVMSPRVWEDFEGLATGISSDKTQLPRPRALEATRFLVTGNGLDVGSPLTSTIFLGNFSDLVLGVRREASVEALKLTTYASNLILEFVGYLRADYMVRRPASFVTIEGVTV